MSTQFYLWSAAQWAGLHQVTHLCSVKAFNTRERSRRHLQSHRTGFTVSINAHTQLLTPGLKYRKPRNLGKLKPNKHCCSFVLMSELITLETKSVWLVKVLKEICSHFYLNKFDVSDGIFFCLNKVIKANIFCTCNWNLHCKQVWPLAAYQFIYKL